MLLRARRLTRLLALAVAGLVAAPAHAAGWWLPGRGASNFSRGGANIADPQDPSALYTNPSGLAGLDGVQLMADSSLAFDFRRFTRAPDDADHDGTTETYGAVQNPSKPWWSPGIFASGNLQSLGIGRLVLGAGVFGPIRTDNQWPEEGAQRYAQIRSYSLEVHFALAAAYELPWLGIRIGAAGMLVNHDVRFRLRLNLPVFGAESTRYDVAADVSASRHAIPVGILSISAAPVSWLVLAASLQPAYDVNAGGTVDIGLGEGLTGVVQAEGDAVKVHLKMAPILRLAAQLRRPALFAVELAWVWEGWHRNDEVVTEPQGITVEQPLGEAPLRTIATPTHWRDTWSVRLGGQYWALPRLVAARAGFFYERSAVPDEWLSAGAFDLDKLGFTLGGRVELPWGLWLDVGGGYVHWLPKTVHDSKVLLLNALAPAEDPDSCGSVTCWPVANGDYGNHQWMVATAVGARFDI